MFEDVVEDFSEVDSVRERFEDWKQTYKDTYQDAYIGLCLPKLLNPYIRLSLINWNPLEVRSYSSPLSYNHIAIVMYHRKMKL